MTKPSDWTWVHYKVLASSGDCLSLPELVGESLFYGFPDGDKRIPKTSREETEAALLDLIAAGAIDVFEKGARLSREQAVEVVRRDSSWTYEMWPDQVEVVDNRRTFEFIRSCPVDKRPYVPLTQRGR